MSPTLLLSVLFAVLCSESNAYLSYQARIPNGDKVSNPCNRSAIWPGVGHENKEGGGPRNPFGLDFKANNLVWNRTVCEKDSDGDGLTNGQELGDPNCTWAEGSTPAFNSNLSHPGICEPLGSPLCSGKNAWLMNCKPGNLNCSGINGSGVQSYTMRFPVTSVPAKETTYMCHRFTLPNDSVADIIAIEPVIDNADIRHHMLIYACADEPINNPKNEPFDCGVTSSSKTCLSLIGVWGVGAVGHCLNSQLGFRIGPGGFQHAIVQLHWHNPEQHMNLTDSSGIKIYYTSQLRPNRGQIAFIGQNYLEIPPGQPEVTFTGTCDSACTKKLPHSIFITTAFLNMHKLGKSDEIGLYRNGTLLRILDNVTHYDYDSATMIEFQDPVELQPGDEVQVKCVYQSIQRNSTTYYGGGTSDEMCFAFFAYYPLIEGVGFCGQHKSINICNDYLDVEFEACDFITLIKLIRLLPQTCAENCTSTLCALIMDGIYATGCDNYPDVKHFIGVFMRNSTEIFQKCALERPPKETTTSSPTNPTTTSSPTNPTTTSSPPKATTIAQCPVSNSPGQSVSLGFGLVLTLMAYAAYY